MISSNFKLDIFVSDHKPVGQRVKTLNPAQWLLYMASPVTFGGLLRVIITVNNDASRHSINRFGFVTKTVCLTRKQVNNADILGYLLSTILETAQI